MKKILSLFLIYYIAILPSVAAITPEEATSQGYLENHGHSGEMARLIDLQNAQINGDKPAYKSTDPDWYSTKSVNFVRRVFMYFDCGLDDGKFMQNDIKFTPRYDNL